MQKEFVRILNKKFRRISWFLCSKQHIIDTWCIWKLSDVCLEIYEVDPARFNSRPGPDLLTDVDMLLMVKKKI